MTNLKSGTGRALLGIAGVVLVLLLVLGARGSGSGRLDRRLLAYRAAGVPTTIEELDRSVPAVPDGANEAAKLRKEQRDWRRPEGPQQLDYYLLDERIQGISRVSTAEIDAVDSNRVRLERLHSISDPRRARVVLGSPIEFDDGYPMFSFQSSFREALGLLRMEFRTERHRQHPDAAARALVSGLRVLRMLEQVPCLAAGLDHALILDGYLQEVATLLSDGTLSAGSLDALQHELELHEGSLGLPGIVQGVRVDALNRYRKSWGATSGTNAPMVAGGPALERFRRTLLKVFGIPGGDLLRTLDAMDEFAKGAHLPAEALQRDEPRVLATAGILGGIRAVVSPSETMNRQLLHDIWNRHLESVARIRCTRTAVAVERWRQDHHGTIPDRLDRLERLVPGTLAAIPLQTTDGKPVVYSTTASGYALEAAYGHQGHASVRLTIQATR